MAAPPADRDVAGRHAEVVAEDSAWTEADLASIRRGAEAVPEAIRRAVGPIRFERIDRECPFATGAYSATCPSFAPDDPGTFYIYNAPPIQGVGPVRRLSVLNASERRDILVRRAVVHAFFARLDRRLRWSGSSEWRRLNKWRGGERPFNRNPRGFSRYLGMRSAHLDLVTFLEEYLVRPEKVLRASEADDAAERLAEFDEAMAVQCQHFSKSRFVAAKLTEVADGWRLPEDLDEFPTGCEAFDRWARLEHLAGIDVVFAAAMADRPQSLWGHLLVHIRHENTSEGFESVYQFGAVTDTDIAPFAYLTRGLTGGFYSVFDPNNFRTVDRVILQYEQRSLRRYRLNLTRAQTLRLLQRIWEVERRHRLPYWFFDENCASLLAELVRSALVGVEIPAPNELVVAPTDVLDLLAGVDNGDRGALLEKRPGDAFSNRAFADWATERRDQALEQMLAAGSTRTANGDREEMKAVVKRLESRRPEVRSAAYERMATLLVDTLEGGLPHEEVKRLRRRALAVVYYSVRIERYYVETHLYRAREILAEARLDPPDYTADELLERRRALYRHEDFARRRRKRIRREQRKLLDFDEAERRPLSEEERAVLQRERRARRAYRAAIRAKRRLQERLSPEVDPVRFVEREDERLRRERARHDARSLGASGKGRLAVGGSSADGRRGGAWWLGLEAAFLHERFGSQRRRGFRPDIETEVFGLELQAPVAEGPFDDLDFEAVLLRYLTVEQLLPPARENLFDLFGYGFDLRAGHDGNRNVDASLQGAAGLLYPLGSSKEFANHLVVGLFPVARWLTTGARDLVLSGVWAKVHARAHLYGDFANSLRLDLGAIPFWKMPGAQIRYEVRAEVATTHLLGTFETGALSLAPYVRSEWTDLAFEGAAGGMELRAGLRFVLPL